VYCVRIFRGFRDHRALTLVKKNSEPMDFSDANRP